MNIRTKPEPSCPDCGEEKMILRKPRDNQDWDPFWGCSLFPECRGTRNIDPDTGLPDMDDEDENPYWYERGY